MTSRDEQEKAEVKPSSSGAGSSSTSRKKTGAARRLSLPSGATAWDLMARELTPDGEQYQHKQEGQRKLSERTGTGIVAISQSPSSSKKERKRRKSSMGIPTLSSKHLAKLPPLLDVPEKDRAPSQKTLLSPTPLRNSASSNSSHQLKKSQRRASLCNDDFANNSQMQQDQEHDNHRVNATFTNTSAVASAAVPAAAAEFGYDNDSCVSDEMLYPQHAKLQQEQGTGAELSAQLEQPTSRTRVKVTRRHSSLGSVQSLSSTETTKLGTSNHSGDKEIQESELKGHAASSSTIISGSSKPVVKKTKSTRRHSAIGNFYMETNSEVSSTEVLDEQTSPKKESRSDGLKTVRSSRRLGSATSSDSADSVDSTTKKATAKSSSSRRHGELKKQKSSQLQSLSDASETSRIEYSSNIFESQCSSPKPKGELSSSSSVPAAVAGGPETPRPRKTDRSKSPGAHKLRQELSFSSTEPGEPEIHSRLKRRPGRSKSPGPLKLANTLSKSSLAPGELEPSRHTRKEGRAKSPGTLKLREELSSSSFAAAPSEPENSRHSRKEGRVKSPGGMKLKEDLLASSSSAPAPAGESDTSRHTRKEARAKSPGGLKLKEELASSSSAAAPGGEPDTSRHTRKEGRAKSPGVMRLREELSSSSAVLETSRHTRKEGRAKSPGTTKQDSTTTLSETPRQHSRKEGRSKSPGVVKLRVEVSASKSSELPESSSRSTHKVGRSRSDENKGQSKSSTTSATHHPETHKLRKFERSKSSDDHGDSYAPVEPENPSTAKLHKRSSSKRRLIVLSSEPVEQSAIQPPVETPVTIVAAEPSHDPSAGSSESTSLTVALTPTSSFSSASTRPVQLPPHMMIQSSPLSTTSGSSSSATRNSVPTKSILKTTTGGLVDLAGERRFSSTGLLPETRKVQSSRDLMRLSAAPQPPQRVLERRKSDNLVPSPQRGDDSATTSPTESPTDGNDSKKDSGEQLKSGALVNKKDAAAGEKLKSSSFSGRKDAVEDISSPSTHSHSSRKKKNATKITLSTIAPPPPAIPPATPPLTETKSNITTPLSAITKSILKITEPLSATKSILKHTKETPQKLKLSHSLSPGLSKVDFSGEHRFSSTGLILARSSSGSEARAVPSLYQSDDESEEDGEGADDDDVLSQANPSTRNPVRRRESMDMKPKMPLRRSQSIEEEEVNNDQPAASVDSLVPRKQETQQKQQEPLQPQKSILKKTPSAVVRRDSDDLFYGGVDPKTKSLVRSRSVEDVYGNGRSCVIPCLDDNGQEEPMERRRGGTRTNGPPSRRLSLDLTPAMSARTSGSSVGSLGSASNHSNPSVPRIKSTYSGNGILLRCEQTMHDLPLGSSDSKSIHGNTSRRRKDETNENSGTKNSFAKEKDKKSSKSKKSLSSSKSKHPDDTCLPSLSSRLSVSSDYEVNEDELDTSTQHSAWDWQEDDDEDEDHRTSSRFSSLDQYQNDPYAIPTVRIIPDTPAVVGVVPDIEPTV